MSELDSGDKVLLQRGIERLNAANEIMRFLSDYFRDKYGLTPEHQVQQDGTIIGPLLRANQLEEREESNNHEANLSHMPL